MMDADDHAQAAAAAVEADQRLGRQRGLASLLRLAVFALIVFLVILSLESGSQMAVLGAAGGMVGFVALALWIGRLDDRRGHQQRLAGYHRRGTERMAGVWDHGQDDGAALVTGWHPYARDLDLIGPGGLYALLNTAGSTAGRQALGRILMDDDEASDQVLVRQQQVAALTPAHAWRAELAVSTAEDAVRARSTASGTGLMADWLGRRGDPPPPWLALPVWLLRLLAAGVIITLATVAGTEGLWLGLLIMAIAYYPLNLYCVRRWAGALRAEDARSQVVRQARGLAVLAQAPGQAPALESLRQQAGAAAAALESLAQILDAHAKRANALWLVVGGIILIEWRNVVRLHAWADQHGSSYAAWLEVLGQGEALACLATCAAEQGGCQPEIVDHGPVFEAEELAHPLLPRATRIGNDIHLEEGQVLLLTGANASGKSTFLRSVALAQVMARLGLPVCARSCRLRLLRLATVMRVHDDLLAGRSRFQAEVEALRRVLDLVEASQGRVLLVLDEILGGTNSRERHLGTRAILDHLRGRDALALVSTHDLALADLASDEAQRFHLAHFADRARLDGDAQGHGADVIFDYRLRPGVVASTNALAVMRSAGLPVPPGA